MGSSWIWTEREGSIAMWPGEGFGGMLFRTRARKSAGWTLVETEGPGAQCCSRCGQEYGRKA